MKLHVTSDFAWQIYENWEDEGVQERIEALAVDIKRANREWARNNRYASEEILQEHDDMVAAIHDRSFWFKFAALTNWEFDF